MTTALATTQQTTLARPLEFTAEQYKMIRDTYASGANEQEFAVLMEIAKARNLNPLLRQIWFIKRWDNMKRCEVWAVQTSIDGLRTIAQRTGLYDGQDEPTFGVEDASAFGLSKAEPFASVSVYRKDWTRPSTVKAYMAEYIGRTRDGKPTQMWAGKPHIMLSKCAEALALRKAFPEDTAGLYVTEEMPANDEREAPAQRPAKPQAVKAAQFPRGESSSAAPTQPVPHLPPPVAEDAQFKPAPAPVAGVVSEARTEAGSVLRIVDVPEAHAPSTVAPEPQPPADEPGSNDVSACDELMGLLGTIPAAEWIRRKNAAQTKGLLAPADIDVLRAAYTASMKGGK